jgi:N-dimethylarginine dimethylaminohydrolase
VNARVFHTPEELDALDLASVPDRPEPKRVLMCTPEHFDVVDVKNAFMAGNVGAVDSAEARREWAELRRAFEAAGHEVVTIPAAEGLEDMVFSANQVLPGVGPDGEPYVLLSRMRYPSRQREVPHYRAWFEGRGYKILTLGDSVDRFEGQGDALWHPGKQLLWGGYGQRTSLEAYDAISEALGVPVIALGLADPRFYHLDTCFAPLAADAALVFPGAFTETGREVIARVFPRVIEASERDAIEFFACNAHALDEQVVIIQRGADETVAKLRAAGFDVVEVETREFMKSGGSVACLKMMVY